MTYGARVGALVATGRVVECSTTPVDRVSRRVEHLRPVDVHCTNSVGHHDKPAWPARSFVAHNETHD